MTQEARPGYEILSLDELGRYPSMSGAPVLMPLRRRLGIRAFGVNCWTAELGEHVIERHAERDGDEELYIVVRGRARFTVGDETADAPPGTLVHVLPGTMREAIATEPDTLVLAVGAKIGEAFEPKSWEDFQIAFAQRRAGGIEEARKIRETLDRRPAAWQGSYNAACFEALEQNPDAAFEHLRRALALAPKEVRRFADESSDLRSLHDDPRWQELFG